jgi:hypothetical protein
MSSLPDEIDGLILGLAASLHPPQYDAFIAAARAAVGAIPLECMGVGSAYRALIAVQRVHWDPPIGEQGARDSARSGKLVNLPPIGRPWVRARRAG